ncbi:2'-5' RNA ligase family protein [Streptomyces sp. NBC_00237]|uniref:2'-5' RNA ligase family protein n=1 Tax=Streptomyces sp. NBC_00237 TaxID=2975687 RepID=UPI0022567242|nr:2'-5' RNA ligase family protein [Streptomyces sp. NBC_00237]MCX5205443.1 2'-5' RNA ligase family protein [Streptomyces sp. NBC_00237]
MPTPGTTAVLALLPEADPLLDLAAGVDARAVRPGVPAHAALLYPWLAAGRIGAAELDRLRNALVRGAAGADRIPVLLAEAERTGGFVGVPVPELHALATAVRTAFPEQVPYGGRFGQDPPVHVTVALDADADTAADIAHRVTGRLPIRTEVSTVHVVTLTPDGWRGLAKLPLTG